MAAERVLVVDSSADNRDSLADLLRCHGFSAEPVDCPTSLLDRLRAAPADLVVTETFGDPAHTCQMIWETAPGVGVAFHTTRSLPADIRWSHALGCAHFVKPDGASPLVAWLVNCFAGRNRPDCVEPCTPRTKNGGPEVCISEKAHRG